ncbi:MAG: maleylpyruvate isomerase family mycothiol-dependent enzyme [Cyclobacteriaceae bacterium]|nr:maleylpyruvate isomerase family mycothiol-dependent enzyme [Cyclobacteriaceae bacterium]
MIATLHLFEPVEQKLIELLKSLEPADWNKPTVAGLWTVKDIAAHLLDTSVRTLALFKNFSGDPPGQVSSYQDIVSYLNRLNADWVKAMKRVSPDTLIAFLQLVQKPMIDYYHSLDLHAHALFSVAWAGESESKNWFHIAREYTERWHHQQQIRDAVHQDGIMSREFFYPMIDTLLRALPHNYRNTNAPDGTCVQVHITGSAGGTWIIQSHSGKWGFIEAAPAITTTLTFDPDTAWKLFTKALTQEQAEANVKITGTQALGAPVLKMVAVMG